MFLSALPTTSTRLEAGKSYTLYLRVEATLQPSEIKIKSWFEPNNTVIAVSRGLFSTSYSVAFTPKYNTTLSTVMQLVQSSAMDYLRRPYQISWQDFKSSAITEAPTIIERLISTATPLASPAKAYIGEVKSVAIIAIVGFSLFYLLPVITPLLKKISRK